MQLAVKVKLPPLKWMSLVNALFSLTSAVIAINHTLLKTTPCLNKTSTLPTNCKPIQIVFGRNTAEKIWNKLTQMTLLTLIRCASLVHIVKWHIFLSIP